MKKHILLVLLLVTTLGGALAQSRPYLSKASKKRKSSNAPSNKGSVRLAPELASAAKSGAAGSETAAQIVFASKVKLKKPVLVYYEEPTPGRAVQQLIMPEESLGLLKSLDLETLMARSEVFVDGLSNRALPGNDMAKYRLLGTSAVAEATRRPAGDGRSFYSRLKMPSSGLLYVVRESAEEYRHFVKGPQRQGAFLDFTSNGLPSIDSVRAVYTLRKMDASERGAGSGQTIR